MAGRSSILGELLGSSERSKSVREQVKCDHDWSYFNLLVTDAPDVADITCTYISKLCLLCRKIEGCEVHMDVRLVGISTHVLH